MWGFLKRLCIAFAVVPLLFASTRKADADIIQQYTATNSNSAGTATFSDPSSSGTYPASYADNGGNTVQGQSVSLPANVYTYSYQLTTFNFYTGGTYNGSSGTTLPTPYAPSGTTLYVFQDNTAQGSETGGAYSGSPTSLTTSTNGNDGSTVVGYSTGMSNGAYTFNSSGAGSLVLQPGNTYYFYVGYTQPDTFAFDVAGFSGPTPESDGMNDYTGDQRYRAPSNNGSSYDGPTDSMTLFSLSGTAGVYVGGSLMPVAEPSRAIGMLGMGIIGTIGLCFGFARKRKPAVC